jgi:hypothetical protein
MNAPRYGQLYRSSAKTSSAATGPRSYGVPVVAASSSPSDGEQSLDHWLSSEDQAGECYKLLVQVFRIYKANILD